MILFRTTGHDVVSASIGEDGPQARMMTVLPSGRARFSAWITRCLASEPRDMAEAGPGGTGRKQDFTRAEYKESRGVEEPPGSADRDTPRTTSRTRERTS